MDHPQPLGERKFFSGKTKIVDKNQNLSYKYPYKIEGTGFSNMMYASKISNNLGMCWHVYACAPKFSIENPDTFSGGYMI